jgi:hypothetical protein
LGQLASVVLELRVRHLIDVDSVEDFLFFSIATNASQVSHSLDPEVRLLTSEVGYFFSSRDAFHPESEEIEEGSAIV